MGLMIFKPDWHHEWVRAGLWWAPTSVHLLDSIILRQGEYRNEGI